MTFLTPELLRKSASFEYDFASLNQPYYHENRVYVLDEGIGLRVFDVFNPMEMQLAATKEWRYWNNTQIEVVDDIMYMCPFYKDSLMIMNISNIDSIYMIASYQEEEMNILNFVLEDDLAFISMDSFYLVVLDISDPSQPKLISRTIIGGSSLQVSGEFAYTHSPILKFNSDATNILSFVV